MKSKTIDFMEVECRILVTRDWGYKGEEEKWEKLVNGYNVADSKNTL